MMDENPQTVPPPTYPDGSRVLCADGQTLGEVVATYREYLIVEQGHFFPTNFYVPYAAIAEAGGGEIVLSLNGPDALAQGWHSPPADPVIQAPPAGPAQGAPVRPQAVETPPPSDRAAATAESDGTKAAAVDEAVPASAVPDLAATTTVASTETAAANTGEAPVATIDAAAAIKFAGERADEVHAPVDAPQEEANATGAARGSIDETVAVDEAVEVQSFQPDAAVPPPDQPEEAGTVDLAPSFVGIPGRRLTDAELWSLLEPKDSPAESNESEEQPENVDADKESPDKPGS